jgi:hypothetical protein
MTVPTWPADLPQNFTASSFNLEGPDNVMRSENSVGPAKVRRRTTSNVWKESGELFMTAAQYSAFLTFLASILDGAKAFTFPSQVTGTGELVRMTAPHKARSVAAYWYVSLSLEILP